MRALRDREDPSLIGACEADVLGVELGEGAGRQRREFDLDAPRVKQRLARLAALRFASCIGETVPEREVGRRLAMLQIDDRDMIRAVADEPEPARTDCAAPTSGEMTWKIVSL